MKHVLFIINDLRSGGAEKSLIELLSFFDFTHYQVSLCLLSYEGVYLGNIPKEVNVITIYDKKKSFYRKSFRYYHKHNISLLLSFQIRRKIEKHYDVIVSFMEGYSLLLHSFVTDRTSRNITWIHCDLFNYHYTSDFFYAPEQEQASYEKMDEIVFVSRDSMTNFDKLFRIDVPKRCLYNVVDVEKIQQLSQMENVSNDRLTIVAIGSLYEVKRFDRLIRIAKMFKDDGYSLLFQIIGKGEKEADLIKLRNELNLQNEVEFLGFKQSPYSYLRAADIFVSTSLAEGFSLVISEAFALGIPVVATKTAGALELLDQGRCGLLTEHDDNSIYSAIKLLVDNKGLREEYQVVSRDRALSFNITRTMEEVYDLLQLTSK